MGRILGNIIKWFFWLTGFAVIILFVAGIIVIDKGNEIDQQVREQSPLSGDGDVTPNSTEPPVSNPVDNSADDPLVVPGTVNRFGDLGVFYIDADQFIENWKVQGAQMSYACQYDGPVYISMDPGMVNGQSTGDLGAVFYVSCQEGDIITLSTPHWSDSALHQQVHVVEFTQEITDEQALNFLKVLKVDEGKPIAYFIDLDGIVTEY